MIQAQSRGAGTAVRPQRSVKPVETLDSIQSDATITPARLRQAVLKKQESQPRPQFMSIFDEDSEGDDLGPLSQPLVLSDDEDEFELKLNF
jgi:DNA-binding GntR family transcriptional regulator